VGCVMTLSKWFCGATVLLEGQRDPDWKQLKTTALEVLYHRWETLVWECVEEKGEL
jgi:hypothetical protein